MSTKREAIYNEAARIAGLIGNDATYEQVRTAMRGLTAIDTPAVASAVTASIMLELEERPLRIQALVLTALADELCEALNGAAELFIETHYTKPTQYETELTKAAFMVAGCVALRWVSGTTDDIQAEMEGDDK